MTSPKTVQVNNLSHWYGKADIRRKVIQSISTPFVIDGNSLKVTASIGFSLYPEHGSDADILLKSADKALYKAKYMGKNKIQTFEGL